MGASGQADSRGEVTEPSENHHTLFGNADGVDGPNTTLADQKAMVNFCVRSTPLPGSRREVTEPSKNQHTLFGNADGVEGTVRTPPQSYINVYEHHAKGRLTRSNCLVVSN